MRVWRRACSIGLWLSLAATAGAGCSSGDGGGGASCSTSGDCTEWNCTCKDGTTTSISECLSHVCAGADVCNGMCDSHGGLASAAPLPNVSDSPECDAFCAKAQSLGCSGDPRCERSFWCGIAQGECAEQKRAYLQCEVDQGTWACLQDSGWSLSSTCPNAQCPADAGTD